MNNKFTPLEFIAALLMGLFVLLFGAAATFSAIIIRVIVLFVVSFAVMWLWNRCLVGTISGIAPIVSVWYAFGLLILCNLLIKPSRA